MRGFGFSLSPRNTHRSCRQVCLRILGALLPGWLYLSGFLFGQPALQKDFPVLSGPYLGQLPPDSTPGIFALGIVCTGRYVLNACFSPDLKEFYYSTLDAVGRYTILQMREIEGQWTRPQIAPFSGTYSEADPCLSPDGTRLYFPSNRSLIKEGETVAAYNIWFVERKGSGWSRPQPLGPSINQDESLDIYPSVTQSGSLYFSSNRPGGRGDSDIYRAQWQDGHFTEPENLGKTINTKDREFDAFIAPDESYLVFASRRSEGYGNADLYISFRDDQGRWTPAVNMGKSINSSESEFTPVVTPDGKFFFFTSTRLGQGDIYWVDSSVLLAYRPGKESQ